MTSSIAGEGRPTPDGTRAPIVDEHHRVTCNDEGMRVSIELDPDVVGLIEQAVAERDLTFEQALNDAVRAGLRSRRDEFTQTTVHLGDASVDLDEALNVATALADQELVEKLEQGK